MRKLILILVFMCFFGHSKAQQFKVDSLSIISNEIKPDSSCSLKEQFQSFILNKSGYFVNFKQFLQLPLNMLYLMVMECKKYNLPYFIFFNVVDRESGFRNVKNRVSSANGFMQLMTGTYNLLSDSLNLNGGETPENNISAGAFYLYSIHNFWSGIYSSDSLCWRFTLAEYCFGIKLLQVKNSRGIVVGYKIPNYCNGYINRVMKNYKYYN